MTVTTVHTFYGLQTAELPWHLVVERSISNEGVRARLKGVDCIIWDEASMSSRRIFELANYIHHLLASTDDLMKPFSGKQLIVVGEFLQLPPVPNGFDEGCLLFESPIFKKMLPRKYELTTVVCQDRNEIELLTCLSELRLGKCGKSNERFISEGLSQDLDEHLKENAIHIFFKKTSVMFFNIKMMQALPGTFLQQILGAWLNRFVC